MSKGKLLAFCIVWLVIAVALAAAYRFIIQPKQEAWIATESGSASHYKNTIDFALDSFSGYAVLRSPVFRDELSKQRIRLNLLDDGADYAKRMDLLRKGKAQLAVFTIDALLNVCGQQNTLPPVTIVAIVDETRGADAMVAYKQAVPNIDALNRTDMKFVLTPDSPSETLARVVMSHFNLSNLGAQPFDGVQDAETVYRRYRQATPDTPQVFVLWEPFVSKMLENPNTHVIADSSFFRGYIVDVIIVNRDFLVKNRELVNEVIGAYFRAVYHYRNDMVQLVLNDAKEIGTSLSEKQAETLVNGIWWKNTQENFGHFGLRHDPSSQLQLLEDMIANITGVLMKTHAIRHDPSDGQPQNLFYDKLLQDLQASNFHPGLADESIRDEQVTLRPLSDREWESLRPTGTLKVPDLVFARGTDRLTNSSRVVLEDLIKGLESFPQAYVLVRGNATTKGNLEANRRLAEKRAQAAAQFLIDADVDPNRVRAVGGDPSGKTSVTFELGQLPY